MSSWLWIETDQRHKLEQYNQKVEVEYNCLKELDMKLPSMLNEVRCNEKPVLRSWTHIFS